VTDDRAWGYRWCAWTWATTTTSSRCWCEVWERRWTGWRDRMERGGECEQMDAWGLVTECMLSYNTRETRGRSDGVCPSNATMIRFTWFEFALGLAPLLGCLNLVVRCLLVAFVLAGIVNTSGMSPKTHATIILLITSGVMFQKARH
jgi:hypothetical protein